MQYACCCIFLELDCYFKNVFQVSMETADDQKQLEDNYPLMINNDKCSMNDPVIMKWVKEGV
jgi:hypothetical protein